MSMYSNVPISAVMPIPAMLLPSQIRQRLHQRLSKADIRITKAFDADCNVHMHIHIRSPSFNGQVSASTN